MYDVAIVGCGIVGAAVAYTLARYELGVVVLEADNDVANATSKANSGIIHAGYDPEPGTLMAQLNVEGAAMARQLCQKLDVPYRQCGSLVLAFSTEEQLHLEVLRKRGLQNSVDGLEIWDAATVLARQPNLSCEVKAALYAPTAAVVGPWEYTLALAETAVRNGVELRLESAVRAIDKIDGGYRLKTASGPVEAKTIVNAAGLHADAVHNMAAPPAFKIIPDKGEYYLLDKSEGSVVEHVVFQCPTALGKGTLVSPTAHGNLIVGPNNELQTDAEDVSTTAAGLAQVAAAAQKSVPGLRLGATIRTFSGVRATSDHSDFIIAEAQDAPGFIDLAGIKSPGLTAAPAIGQMVAQLLESGGLALRAKPHFIDTRRRVSFATLPTTEKQRLVRENPAYGRVICRCETITEGEILDALHSPIPPRSIEAVKRRCNAGMGRCQGGFCGPRILELMTQELGLSPLDILQDKPGSVVLTGETKGGGCHACAV